MNNANSQILQINNQRVYNFSPGPSMLPTEVLKIAQQELLNYRNSGMSVMEISHRGGLFQEIMDHAIADFRRLYNIPNNYQVLFMQGGASAQNSLIPLNLLKQQQSALYAVTGNWSKKTYDEALRYQAAIHDTPLNMQAVCQTSAPYLAIPDIDKTWQNLDQAALQKQAYLHLCTNETIDGVQFNANQLANIAKKYAGVPMVLDMSSDILSESLAIEQFGVIYGGAQKNIGISGLTFLIIRDDLLNKALDICPKVFNWQHIHAQNSLLNTPCTYAIYLAGLVFKHWLNLGGLPYLQEQNQRKAQLIYQTIDESQLYQNQVDIDVRSKMNVVFQLKNEALNTAFLEAANAAGLTNLKGHKQVGGMRASIYNAMPLAGVEKLTAFMQNFEKNH